MLSGQEPVTSSLILRVVALCWLFAALIVGETRALALIPVPAVQGILVALTLIIIAAFRLWPAFHEWVLNTNVRCLIAFHLTRFVGIYFLVLHGRGELPYEFAVLGGYGDIAVASLAVPLLFLSPQSGLFRPAALTWNILGLADILFVVFTAARSGLTTPDSMQALTHLPLSLLPTFVVPLIIASHLFLFIRLARR